MAVFYFNINIKIKLKDYLMKPNEFITENRHIVQAVVEMHDDHEIQLAREQCYTAASNAIDLHRMLKQITERQGLEAWIQEKITLASNYLQQVKDWLENDLREKAEDEDFYFKSLDETVSAGGTSSGSVAVSMGPLKTQRRSTNETDLHPPIPKLSIPRYLHRNKTAKKPIMSGQYIVKKS